VGTFLAFLAETLEDNPSFLNVHMKYPPKNIFKFWLISEVKDINKYYLHLSQAHY